jgi:UDP-N-acetylglucosamine 2-epimerase (non-hydrolysing)
VRAQDVEVTVFFELDLRRPDGRLGVGSGSHADQTARVMIALDPVMTEVQPDVVVVVGVVNSTIAAALLAAKSPARLVRVEAACAAGTGRCRRR